MRHFEMCNGKPSGWLWNCAGAAVLALAVTGNVYAQTLQISSLRIESVPVGADVELIGGRAGVTPLSISERDIYPNNYPDARADLYGMVVLSHPGCEPLRHRVTMGDLKQGLQLRLDCIAAALPPAATSPSASPALSTMPAPAARETLSEKRLHQLQVLQELLDEGLISPAEEQRVRRLILQTKVKPGTGQ